MEPSWIEDEAARARRFESACLAVCGRSRERAGIGTLSEKTLHAVLKRFIEPDETLHEAKLGGCYADVRNASGVFEIQTRSFDKLRAKLAILLESERVTLVYPIPAVKRLIWMEPQTGALTAPRKSPKRGSYFDAFAELYKLGALLSHPALRVLLLLIDMDEYRYLDGWGRDGKKGSTRCERIPRALTGARLLASSEDYARLLPSGLPARFTSRDIAALARIRLRTAQIMMTVLQKRGALRCVGRQGRLKLYEIAI